MLKHVTTMPMLPMKTDLVSMLLKAMTVMASA